MPILALILAADAHPGHHPPAPPASPPGSPASAAAPGWVERDGPWTAGNYVDFAVGADGSVHAIWLEGRALQYVKVGGKPVRIATDVESGDNGQMRPEIVLDGKGMPVVAYTSGGHVFLARYDAAWAPKQIDHAEAGDRELLALAMDGDLPTLAWLDTRASPADHRAAIWVGTSKLEAAIYSGGADGVCMCCRPALARRGAELWLAFRDADGPKREVRAMSIGTGGWVDRGDQTHGGWSPGGCPTDGPVIAPDAIYVSDARDGKRRIWKVDSSGEHALPPLDATKDAVQPRVIPDGSVVTWVEVGAGDATLVMLEGATPMPVTHASGRFELGDPVVVGQELWIPYEGDHARVLVQTPPGR